jgi:paraquat-inducible protein A
MKSTAAMIACRICGQVHAIEPLSPNTLARCSRCGATITRRTSASLQLTAAFSLAALLLYLPANIFPILRINLYGATQDNTIWEGCVRFVQDGDYVIAVIVFLASIFIPLLKLLGLFYLVVSKMLNLRGGERHRTWVYRIIDSIGRWAMLDVFVLAILVSLVRLQSLATVIPGEGALAFALVVVFTLIASASFDPQLIWDREESTT